MMELLGSLEDIGSFLLNLTDACATLRGPIQE